MANQPYSNLFQDVHKKIQDKKDGLRRANEHRTGIRREDAEKEAVEKGFDRPATDTPESKDEIKQ
jgi:hypothetical protein